MPTRVLLLRHGESADPNVFHGAESDIDLSERGRRQAELIARELVVYQPEAVVSSGMRRARTTAAPIARECGMPVRVEAALHERRVGKLAGSAFDHGDVWPETLRRWMAGETGYAPEGAESFNDIRDRVLPVWERLVAQYADQTIVIVAHGVVCKVLLFTLLSGYSAADWKRFGPIRNVAISELLRMPTGWEAVRLNELPSALQAA
jgi:broad specificity phosphatase PhoE